VGTLLASQSLAAGATVTSAAFPFSVYDDVTVTVLNGGAAPTQPPQVTLLLSPDNVNYTAVDRRTTGMVPSQAYYHLFPLQNYAGWSPGEGPWDFLMGGDNFTGTVSGLATGAVNAIQSAKLKFENLGSANAVTVAANDGCTQNLAVVPITPTGAGGIIAAWAPPGGGAQLVTRVIINVPTASTGAAALNVGIAANATTSSSTLIVVGLGTVHSIGVLDSIAGLTGPLPALAQSIPSGSYVTFNASAATTGMVATAYIFYLKP